MTASASLDLALFDVVRHFYQEPKVMSAGRMATVCRGVLSLPVFGEGRVGFCFNWHCIVERAPPRPPRKRGGRSHGDAIYEPMRIIGLAGWSGSGKTTLLAKIIPRLVARGLTVSTVKHAHHGFDVDTPGKDSHTHRMAGATEVLVASGKRWALMHELREAPEPSIYDLLGKMSPVDLVLIEGFKSAHHTRIEVYRKDTGKLPFHQENPHVVGIVSDTPFPNAGRPVVDIDDIEGVVELILSKAERLETMLERVRAEAVGDG
jgi:molybdopterin-guanine dinucleotide biosynthesis adapter protein